MILELKSHSRRNFDLQVLNFFVFEFKNFAALKANQMIVMATVFINFVDGTFIQKSALDRQTRLHHATDRAVHAS
jgi:hypothetical protein